MITVSPSWNQNYFYKKANLRDLIAATGLVILLKLSSNDRFFSHGTLKFYWWPRKIIAHLFYITSSFVHHLKPLGEFELQLLSGNAQFGSKSAIFAQYDIEIQWMTLKNNRDPLLCYIKFCASFQSHRWIQTKVTVRKRSIRAKMGHFFAPCDLTIWWITLKNNIYIGHLFYVASSFVHHFKAIGEFKLKLQSGNAQFASKSAIYCPVWPSNLMDDLEKQ